MYSTSLLHEIKPLCNIFINTGIVSLIIKGEGGYEFNVTTTTLGAASGGKSRLRGKTEIQLSFFPERRWNGKK